MQPKTGLGTRLENIMLIKLPIYAMLFMLKHCGNYAAVLTNYVYASFLHQNTSVIHQGHT